MACRDWEGISSEDCARASAESETGIVRDKLDKVTRLLCSVLREGGIPSFLDDDAELYDWWEEHRVLDQKRIEQEKQVEALVQIANDLLAKKEKLIESARRKLRPAERRALGLE